MEEVLGVLGRGGVAGLHSPEQINPSSVMMLCVHVSRCLCRISRIRCCNVGWISPFICFNTALIGTPLHFFFEVSSLRFFQIPNHHSLFSLATHPCFRQVGLDWGGFDIISNICYTFPSSFFPLAVFSFVFSKAFHPCQNYLSPWDKPTQTRAHTTRTEQHITPLRWEKSCF